MGKRSVTTSLTNNKKIRCIDLVIIVAGQMIILNPTSFSFGLNIVCFIHLVSIDKFHFL